MSESYRHRLRQLQSILEPGLRRMLLFSFILHLIVPLVLSGVLKSTHKTPQVPVYRVNLINKPVKNPQAGRPDAAPTKKKKKSLKKKVTAPKTRIKQSKTVKTSALPKKSVVRKQPGADKLSQEALQKRLSEMQAEAARQAKLDRIRAALATQQAELGKPGVQAPVGEPDGKGDEIGLSLIRYVEGFITEQWRLSPYQVPGSDLQAEIRVSYSVEGRMRNWEFVEKSGHVLFDDSLRRAMLKARDLGKPLPVPGTFEIIFNLKDLQRR